MMVRVTEW